MDTSSQWLWYAVGLYVLVMTVSIFFKNRKIPLNRFTAQEIEKMPPEKFKPGFFRGAFSFRSLAVEQRQALQPDQLEVIVANKLHNDLIGGIAPETMFCLSEVAFKALLPSDPEKLLKIGAQLQHVPKLRKVMKEVIRSHSLRLTESIEYDEGELEELQVEQAELEEEIAKKSERLAKCKEFLNS